MNKARGIIMQEVAHYIDIVNSLQERRKTIGIEYLDYIKKEIETYGEDNATILLANTINTAFLERVKDVDEKIEHGKEIVRAMKATYNNIF